MIALSNLVVCNDDKAFGAAIAVDGNSKTSLGSTVLGRSLAISQTGDHPKDSKDIPITTAAVLTEPASRAYKCFLKTNINCEMFTSENSAGKIIGPAEFPEKVPRNGKIASGGNLLYDILDQHSVGRWNPSRLRIREHNETHFATEIMWVINANTSKVDIIKVFLSNSNYTADQSIQRSVLNLVCSHQSNSDIKRHSYVVRFNCYIQNEFVKDLLYGAQGLGVLVSTLRIVGKPYAFYQIADISLHEPVRGVGNFHGFVSNPTSRAKLCQLRVNKNCGPIMYEPQSVEGLQGFPHGVNSPPDGKIASGNNPIFNQLNEYGSDRWTSVEFPEVNCHNKTHVQFDLTWYFTATHSSDNIEIYISNEKYTSTEPLSRRHLDLNPLCSMDFHGHYPPSQLTMSCPISLEKYRQLNELKELLLLSVWNIDDTAYAFYQVVDLQGLSPKQSLKNIKKKCRL